MRRYFTTGFFIVLCTVFQVIQALAQPPIPGGQDMGDRERHEKIREMIKERLVNFLELSSDQKAQILPFFQESFDTTSKLRSVRREKVREISDKIMDNAVTVNELEKHVNDLDSIDREMEKTQETFLKKSRKLLNDRQYIKLVIFQDWLKLDLMEKRDRSGDTERSQPQVDVERSIHALERSNEDLKRSMGDIQQTLRDIQQTVRDIQSSVRK